MLLCHCRACSTGQIAAAKMLVQDGKAKVNIKVIPYVHQHFPESHCSVGRAKQQLGSCCFCVQSLCLSAARAMPQHCHRQSSAGIVSIVVPQQSRFVALCCSNRHCAAHAVVCCSLPLLLLQLIAAEAVLRRPRCMDAGGQQPMCPRQQQSCKHAWATSCGRTGGGPGRGFRASACTKEPRHEPSGFRV